MREHPEWFIVHEQTGEPMRAGHNTNWTTSSDPYAYALDPSNPGFRAHLEHLFRKLGVTHRTQAAMWAAERRSVAQE